LLWGEPGRSARGFGFSAAGVEPVADVVRARTVLQRLKPDSSSRDCGTAKQLAEKVARRRKNIPQRLKPAIFCTRYGTAEQLAEKVSDDTKTSPLRLKPNFIPQTLRSG
jgi:hypothetical protein